MTALTFRSQTLSILSRSLPFSSLLLNVTLAAQAPTGAGNDPIGQAAAQAAAAGGQAPQPGTLHSLNVSLDVMAALGGSTERNGVLGTLQAGGHDPKQRGFTLQQAELGLSGVVDQYFAGEAMISAVLQPDTGETVVELEEAYLVSTSLPNDLQIKAGHYLTEFGRMNPVHGHSWAWLDQPIINSRIFGGDGMRAPGARLGWELPGEAPAQLIVGVQNASGETVPSFLASSAFYEEQGIGGRSFAAREVRSWNDYLFSARFDTDRKLDDATTLGLGASIAFGPNATGNSADTLVYGADFCLRWKGDDHRAFQLQGEVIARDFQAAEQIDANDPTITGDEVTIPGATLKDYGCYLQGLYKFGNGFAAGLRGEWATGSGASYDTATDTLARNGDPFRADRVRISPLLAYEISNSSRVRLQYSYDDADQLADPAHSVWFGYVMMLGHHPQHVYRPSR